MKIRKYTGGMVMTNAYLLGEGADCVLIDAPDGVTEWLEQLGELPKEVLLTHQHYDHVEDVALLAGKGVRVRAYADYSQDLTLENFRAQWGLPIEVQPYSVDDVLKNVTSLDSGAYPFRVEHIPGHSTDSIAFITEVTDPSAEGPTTYAFVGDTLFANSIGRPDLPGGDQDLLLDGIHEKLLCLPDGTCLLYTSPSPRDKRQSRMPSSA